MGGRLSNNGNNYGLLIRPNTRYFDISEFMERVKSKICSVAAQLADKMNLSSQQVVQRLLSTDFREQIDTILNFQARFQRKVR